MNGIRQTDTDEGLLKSMIALMLGLALSAERAAGRCYAVRCFVLWALRRAEPIALRYVLGLDDTPTVSAFSTLLRNSRDDALELADLFRAAAQVMKAELRDIRRLGRWWERHEARLARFTSPFEGGGRAAGAGGGEHALLRVAATAPESRRRNHHIVLKRARIPAWAAINWPDLTQGVHCQSVPANRPCNPARAALAFARQPITETPSTHQNFAMVWRGRLVHSLGS